MNRYEQRALLETIRQDPDSDGPRLVYADWLEEYGDGKDRMRAKAIRGRLLYTDRLETMRALFSKEVIAGSTCDRGFIGKLRCDLNHFMVNAGWLFAHNPTITRVELMDREPWMSRQAREWYWSKAGIYGHLLHDIPGELFELMTGSRFSNSPHHIFGTREEALESFSKAAITYGFIEAEKYWERLIGRAVKEGRG